MPIGPLRWLIVAYVELWRNTPLIVQLFWVHFGLPVITGVSTTALESGFLALTLQSSAYLADIARAGIQAVARGQWQRATGAAVAVRSWLEIVLPQALKIMIPPFGNLALSFLNGSALLGLLQVGELMTVATKISDYTFKPIEVMTAVGVLYLRSTWPRASHQAASSVPPGARPCIRSTSRQSSTCRSSCAARGLTLVSCWFRLAIGTALGLLVCLGKLSGARAAGSTWRGYP